MKKSFLIGATIVILLCGMESASGWEDVLPQDTAAMLDPASITYNPNAYILDVRTVAEYKFVGHPAVSDGHIRNIPYWKFEFDRASDEYIYYDPVTKLGNVNKFFDEEVYRFFNPATDTIIVVCRSGGRAGMAADDLEDPSEPASNRLEELGFFDIRRMVGGFTFGWEPENLPVSTGFEGIWKPSDFQGRKLK